MLPAITLVEPVLVVATLAWGVTVVVTLAEEEEPLLFEASGSLVVEVLDTVLVNGPLTGAVMVTVKLVVAALAKLVMVGHVTTPALFVPPLDALTNVAPAGNVSLTTTLLAVDRPRFVTVIV